MNDKQDGAECSGASDGSQDEHRMASGFVKFVLAVSKGPTGIEPPFEDGNLIAINGNEITAVREIDWEASFVYCGNYSFLVRGNVQSVMQQMLLAAS